MNMHMLTLAWNPLLTAVLVVVFLLVCVMLILTVLIQRPQGGGLGGAFGGAGAGSGQTAFGAKTGDALTIATIGMFVLYLVTAVVLNYAVQPGDPVTPELRAVGDDGAPRPPAESPPLTIPFDPEAGFDVDPGDLPERADPAEDIDTPPAEDADDDGGVNEDRQP